MAARTYALRSAKRQVVVACLHIEAPLPLRKRRPGLNHRGVLS